MSKHTVTVKFITFSTKRSDRKREAQFVAERQARISARAARTAEWLNSVDYHN